MGALDRHRALLDFALAGMARRKAKHLALLGVYTLVVALLASLVFFLQALKAEARDLLTAAPDLVVQRLVAGRHDLIPVSHAAKLADLRGVESVRPRRWGYHFDALTQANFTIVADEGGDLAPGAARLGGAVAKLLRTGEGDLITLRTSRGLPLLLTVQAILPEATDLVAADTILVGPEDFQALFDFPMDQATDLALRVPNPQEVATVASKVAARLPDCRTVQKSELLRTYDAIFDGRGGLSLLVLGVALLAFAILAWDRASGLSAEERRELGILKALGWSTEDVLLLRAWEGVSLSLVAFLLGTLLGYAHVTLGSAWLFGQALKGWSVLQPALHLAPKLDPYTLGVLGFLTVAPYAAATVLPAWRAASADPDAALRS